METLMTERRLRLLEFAIDMHGNQIRKYTADPYWFHLIRVGEMAEAAGVPLGLEIGLCHDLLEDTQCTSRLLAIKLTEFGYNDEESKRVVDTTVHLTDEYTRRNYPTKNRYERKRLEAKRLWSIPVDAQTVKYCDIIDNLSSIVEHDAGFAKVFLAEKRYILQGMDDGDASLLAKAREF